MGLIYRCLFTGKNTIAVPAISLLENFATFRRGVMTNDLYSHFDLTAKAIPRILSMKGDVTATSVQRRLLREKFIRFYLEFISNSSIIVRRDLVAQKNVISGWFKHMNDDSADLIRDTLEVFDKKIIKDSGFTKPLRMNLFNDWVMGHLANLLGREDSPSDNSETKIGTLVFEFLKFLATDSLHGLKHNDKQWYLPEFEGTERGSGETVNNTILFGFLKVLKPWDNIHRQNLALDILSSSPELVAPYFSDEWSFSLEPKITMFWISSILFLSRVIELPIPSPLSNSFSLQPPNVKVISEHIFPQPLSKSILSKSLLSSSPLIKYNALQVIILAFKKLEVVIKLYSDKNWSDGYYELLEEVGNRFPEITTLVNSITSLENDTIDNYALLKSATIRTIAYYSRLLPELFNKTKFVLPTKLMSTLEKADLSGFELVDLQNVLEIQTRLGGLGKWWNKSGDMPYSLFTVLLRIATVLKNNVFTVQIDNLIQYLCKPTLIFQHETNKLEPTTVLINSLIQEIPKMEEEEKIKIWKLLDESVSRCQRSPYKYIDIIASYQKSLKTQSSGISPFIAVVIEQWKYVDKTTEFKNAENWFFRYIRDSCIAGSNPDVIQMVIEKEGLGSELEGLISYPAKPYNIINSLWSSRFSTKSTFDIILCSSDRDELLKQTIQTKLDLYAAKFRLKHDNDELIQNILLNKLTSELVPKLRGMLLKSEVFLDILSHEATWGPFFKQLGSEGITLQNYDTGPLILYLKEALVSSIGPQKKLHIFKVSSFLLDVEFVKTQISSITSNDNNLDKHTQNFLEILYVDLLRKITGSELLTESQVLVIIDYAAQIHSGDIFAALREYIHNTGYKFVTTSALLTHIHKYCKDTTFSSSRLLQAIVRAVPSSELSLLHLFTDSSLVDDFTFLSVLTEITTDNIETNTSEKKEKKLGDVYSHGVEVSLLSLSNSSKPDNANLLETSIEFLSKVITTDVLPIEDKNIEKVVKFIGIYTGKETISPNMIKLVGKLSSKLTGASKISESQQRLMKPVRIWGQRTITWLAKRLAEDLELGIKTLETLKEFFNVISTQQINLWLIVPTTSLNTMLEIAITRYLDRIEVLQFVAAVIPTSRVLSSSYSINPSNSSDKKYLNIEITKLLQIILNHDQVVNSMEIARDMSHATGTGIAIAYIVSTLFNIDVTRHSTRATQEKVLALCQGTKRPQDMLLVEILKKIESRVSASFCDMVYSWEITTSSALATILALEGGQDEDSSLAGSLASKRKRKINDLEDMLIGHTAVEDGLDGVTPLFTAGKGGFEVTFDSGLIQNSIKNFDTTVPFDVKPPNKVGKHVESYSEFLTRMQHYSRSLRAEMTYSTEFFLLLITSSSLLVHDESSLVVDNLRVFTESGVLALVICGLCETEPHINKLALSLLVATSQAASDSSSSNNGYSDKELVSILSNRIFSFITEDQEKRKQEELVSSVVTGKGLDKSSTNYPLLPSYLAIPFANILTTIVPYPEGLLYDKIIQGFLFHSATLNKSEVPMFHSIARATNTAEHYGDSLLREFIWFVDNLTASLVDNEALEVYAKRGVFEWALNLANTLPIPSSALITSSSGNHQSLASDSQRESEAAHVIYSSKMYLKAYNTLVHHKIVGLIKRAQEIKGGAEVLAIRNGLISWVQNAVAVSGLVSFIDTDISENNIRKRGNNDNYNNTASNKKIGDDKEQRNYLLAIEKLGVREWIAIPKKVKSQWTLCQEIPLKYKV